MQQVLLKVACLNLCMAARHGNKVGVVSIHTRDGVHIVSKETAVHGKRSEHSAKLIKFPLSLVKHISSPQQQKETQHFNNQ